MISVCVQLAKRIGLRASTVALKIVLDWLSIPARIPCWTSVRQWLCRLGVDELTQARERHEDWIWLADHSNQTSIKRLPSLFYWILKEKISARVERGGDAPQSVSRVAIRLSGWLSMLGVSAGTKASRLWLHVFARG
jgi:hypothetical protein